MTQGRLIVAVLAGGIAYFLLGWLVWGMLLTNVLSFSPEVTDVIVRKEFNPAFMFLSCLIWSGLLTLILGRWANISNPMSGLIAGALIGGLAAFSTNFGMLSQYSFMTFGHVIWDSAATALCSGLVGAVIAFVLRKSDKATA
jgi:hypothetical protein